MALWTPTLPWHYNCKRKRSAEPLATSNLDSRHSSSRVSVVQVSQGSSSLVADHHSQETAHKEGLLVDDLQTKASSLLQTPCSGSNNRAAPSRHSSRQRSPPLAAQLPSGLAGVQRSSQMPWWYAMCVCCTSTSVMKRFRQSAVGIRYYNRILV